MLHAVVLFILSPRTTLTKTNGRFISSMPSPTNSDNNMPIILARNLRTWNQSPYQINQVPTNAFIDSKLRPNFHRNSLL